MCSSLPKTIILSWEVDFVYIYRVASSFELTKNSGVLTIDAFSSYLDRQNLKNFVRVIRALTVILVCLATTMSILLEFHFSGTLAKLMVSSIAYWFKLLELRTIVVES